MLPALIAPQLEIFYLDIMPVSMRILLPSQYCKHSQSFFLKTGFDVADDEVKLAGTCKESLGKRKRLVKKV